MTTPFADCPECGSDDIERVQGGALECCTCGHAFDDLGEPLASLLDLSTWTEAANTQPAWTEEQQAQANAAAEAFSDHVRCHPPKRIA